TTDADGVTLTLHAFDSSLGAPGRWALLLSAFFFAVTSLFAYSYYGSKAMSFIGGVKSARYYEYFYLASIVVAAVVPMSTIINIIDISFALMAIPTMISGFVLAPYVMQESRKYFAKIASSRR